MKTDSQINKLFKVALITSPLIGILAITPIFIIKGVLLSLFPKAVLIITLAIFSVWGLNISFSYASEKYNFGKFAKFTRYLLTYILSAVFTIIAFRMLRFCFHTQIPLPVLTPSHTPYAPAIIGFSINTVVLIIQDLILLRSKKAKIEIENAQLKLKNTEALILQLKQQIHPHFLFNSLNTLKSLIKQSPEAGEDYLVKLSDFLRASVSAGQDNTVKLGDELKLCLDYLEMQKIRYGAALQFSVDIPEEIYQTVFVPVFSLQLLTENAIKHNALTIEYPLQIKMKFEKDRIIVSNNLHHKLTTETSSGMGLINLVERYRILSGDEIIIQSTDEQFSVSIKILTYENSNHRG